MATISLELLNGGLSIPERRHLLSWSWWEVIQRMELCCVFGMDLSTNVQKIGLLQGW